MQEATQLIGVLRRAIAEGQPQQDAIEERRDGVRLFLDQGLIARAIGLYVRDGFLTEGDEPADHLIERGLQHGVPFGVQRKLVPGPRPAQRGAARGSHRRLGQQREGRDRAAGLEGVARGRTEFSGVQLGDPLGDTAEQCRSGGKVRRRGAVR
jgi:hypothetical protein